MWDGEHGLGWSRVACVGGFSGAEWEGHGARWHGMYDGVGGRATVNAGSWPLRLFLLSPLLSLPCCCPAYLNLFKLCNTVRLHICCSEHACCATLCRLPQRRPRSGQGCWGWVRQNKKHSQMKQKAYFLSLFCTPGVLGEGEVGQKAQRCLCFRLRGNRGQGKLRALAVEN